METMTFILCTAILGLLEVSELPTTAESRNETQALADEAKKFKIVNADKIYYGDQKNFKKPAVLSVSKVFNKIPAYQQIKNENLDDKSARYWVLMQEANDIFKKALQAINQSDGYDLIGEIGSITQEKDEIDNITSSVISKIEGKTEGD